ncbi:MAG TPA: 3-deoxy-manno-octulosonate cytidylyltransferase [Alphaproteobacteria bacterium]|nr:3-deoxy-manno-octulosonate cytidylyltransferase [Alphaproteobacteria bacterium]
MTENVCIIPARMASSRFPGKPLEPLIGLPLVLHVLERCRLCASIDRVVVATCDEEIRDAVEQHGGEAVMTADSHPGCVDRTVEAVDNLGLGLADGDLVLMVQGDEVLISPIMMDNVINAFEASAAAVVNLASKIFSAEDHDDPDCVKVVAAADGKALFFSRAPIPSRYRVDSVPMYQQTGVIGFSNAFLHRFGNLSRTPLEMIECIDMLRTLEHGYPIQVVFSEDQTIGVDTKSDLLRAEAVLKNDPITRKYLDIAP